jgi:hypothetical protein
MDNNNLRHPAQRPSGPNKFLQLVMLTGTPVAIYFTDGEVVDECLLVELDTLNLLVKVVATGREMVVTRSTIKKIVSMAEDRYAKRKGAN